MIPGLTAAEEIEWAEWSVYGGEMPVSLARLFWTEQERSKHEFLGKMARTMSMNLMRPEAENLIPIILRGTS